MAEVDEGNFPLTWPVDYAGCVQCPPFERDDGDELRERFENMARWLLWAWTRRLFGTQEVWLMPDPLCHRLPTYMSYPPAVSIPFCCGACGCFEDCQCDRRNVLRLDADVYDVKTVRVDGEDLADDAWEFHEDGQRIVRTDGEDWPRAQSGWGVDTQGSWAVQAVVGRPVPTNGQIAAGVLACELAKAACKDNTCQLPQRVTSIIRQGVTLATIDNFEGIKDGLTGIWLIDSWVQTISAPSGATVLNPDLWKAQRGQRVRRGRGR